MMAIPSALGNSWNKIKKGETANKLGLRELKEKSLRTIAPYGISFLILLTGSGNNTVDDRHRTVMVMLSPTDKECQAG
jgi:hypothetical protein